MNQVVKTLRIAPASFVPLWACGSGIDGMSVKKRPRFRWFYGYALILGVMALIAGLQTYFLWRRGWFLDWTAMRL
ncbi:hypothetical protein [Synechococcus sp. 1G10]|uniref:hypothetical protein n=1 Tax=Synechococcus sp. 1G10 TaxID=2025605 RepID=UPI000B999856|nr:hypothetical protein [Synechococcus sp. 1G10]